MNEYQQIFNTINLGLVVLDRELNVTAWNRWMELHSGMPAEKVIGQPVCDLFPALCDNSFIRIVKSVFAFGNYASYSQKLHKYLFPMKNPHGSSAVFPRMQQNCTFGPIRNDNKEIIAVYISVQDVTDFVMYEHKLIQMAKIDGLTGIYNRRYLDSRLTEEIERSRRHGNPLSILLLDIDHFKKINDTHGHLCGDYALRKISELLQELVRTSDILGRYGGEEFLCILPETSHEQAVVLAERCREQIATKPLACEDHQARITISIGVTGQHRDDTLDSIKKRADDALYQAKREGRNRVCSCPAASEPNP
ncbi:PAS domain S-box-containing protein/diguanylate cyclase (GGDEF) domain-containing protein [Trichlorobacter thiogenes]|uniref:diguanylate cyclase n=1 Tax=Trichlorobacter thiogenes TaxID=115783 RepID=A0A1T4JUP4_9BACT|nr:sensor domain-containing diguanylate cyclase [Trichlorobacter thiogenes]SJZ33839.1 PAS domain S-box-containing protein/diguanylate cyclase (GGDEF) domain-containing protein [Trichlorobacter thiogenes]